MTSKHAHINRPRSYHGLNVSRRNLRLVSPSSQSRCYTWIINMNVLHDRHTWGGAHIGHLIESSISQLYLFSSRARPQKMCSKKSKVQELIVSKLLKFRESVKNWASTTWQRVVPSIRPSRYLYREVRSYADLKLVVFNEWFAWIFVYFPHSP